MLATIGFVTAGIFFWVFALTFLNLVVAKTELNLKPFPYAYYCLGLALIVWGVASFLGTSEALAQSVIIGDGIVLVGTLLMVRSFTNSRALLFLGFILSVVFLLVRVKYYYPEPYIKSGLLIFNTQTPVAVSLGAIFSLIWLPVNLKVSRRVTNAVKQPALRPIFFLIYSMANISAIIFIAARRPIIATLSFAALTTCFLLLIYSNILVSKLGDRHAT